jgi:hypothetical protein
MKNGRGIDSKIIAGETPAIPGYGRRSSANYKENLMAQIRHKNIRRKLSIHARIRSLQENLDY